MKSAERLAKVVQRLTALRETTRRKLDDHAATQQDLTELDGLLAKLDGIKDCLDDAELAEVAREEIEGAEDYLRSILFFKSKPEATEIDIPEPSTDDSWRNERISWRLSDLDIEHPDGDFGGALGRDEILNLLETLIKRPVCTVTVHHTNKSAGVDESPVRVPVCR